MFGFGHRHESRFDGVMRLAFCLDDLSGQVGVELRQPRPDTVRATVTGRADLTVVRAQVARVLSLDHDASGFLAVGRRDPLLSRLQDAAPGLRPPLFYSPYEAAVWAVLSARRSTRQASVLRDRLASTHGRTLQVAGQAVPASPTPAQLLRVPELPGLPAQRVNWLHGIARAALDGQLDPRSLAVAAPDDAISRLRRLAGIGPFYAALILVRASGVTDVLPVGEPKVLALAGELHGLGRAMTPQEYGERAEAWRPWRTWASVFVRAVTGRLSDPSARMALTR